MRDRVTRQACFDKQIGSNFQKVLIAPLIFQGLHFILTKYCHDLLTSKALNVLSYSNELLNFFAQNFVDRLIALHDRDH